VLIAWNLAKWDLRTGQRSEFATVAVALSSQIDQRGPAIHKCPRRREGLARRTMTDVARRIISKFAVREDAIIALDLSNTGICGAMPFSSTIQFSIGAASTFGSVVSATLGPGVHDRHLVIRKHTRHRRQIADVSIDHAEPRDDGDLVGGDRIEIMPTSA
jgi:hypothetical protein